MDWRTMYEELLKSNEQSPKYQTIADAIEEAIGQGRLRSGDRLPTVRDLSNKLGVSATTIASAYQLLGQRDYISGVVGRGTFVKGSSSRETQSSGSNRTSDTWHEGLPWRRRALASTASRLRTAYPSAIDCASGRPDTALLPVELYKRAWHAAADSITHEQLQYTSPIVLPALAKQIQRRLEAEGIQVNETDMVIGSSAQQWLALSIQIAVRLFGQKHPLVAVEEPGYPALFDACEYFGCQLIGMDVDEYGVVPSSLAHALAQGVTALVFTPRAQNPTGASWSRERAAEIARVLANHPGSIVIEDDQFAGITASNPGSMLEYPSLQDRVIYIRSFSKSIAPDLRLAVAIAPPPLRTWLVEAKGYADGWSSRLAQQALAHILAQPELDGTLALAQKSYTERRNTAIRALSPIKGLATVAPAADGLNLWVRLAPGIDAAEVTERAAALGVLVAPGEPFFIHAGHNNAVRLNAGSVSLPQAMMAAEYLATAIARATTMTPTEIVI